MTDKFDEVIYKKLNSEEKYYRGASVAQILTWVFEAWNALSDESIIKSKFGFILLKSLGFQTCCFFEEEEREKVYKRAKDISIGELTVEDPYYIEEDFEDNSESANDSEEDE